MGSKLEEVLEKARSQAGDKGALPGVVTLINRLETEAIQQVFASQPVQPAPRKGLVRVAVGGRMNGQDYLNADGIK